MAETKGYELECFGLTHEGIENAVSNGGAEFGGHFGWSGGSPSGSGGGPTFDAGPNNENNIWKNNSDCTINNTAGRGIGHEIVAPILHGDGAYVKMRQMCKALVRAGAQVNSSCGTHVTIGIDNARTARFSVARKQQMIVRIGEAYDYFADAFHHMVSKSRRFNTNYGALPRLYAGNNYGQGTVDQNRRNFEGGFGRGAVNIRNYTTFGIIEFRQHNGTLNGQKLTVWSKLLSSLIRWAKNDNHPNFGCDVRHFEPNMAGLLDMLSAGTELRRGVNARIAQARGEMPSTSRHMAAYSNFQLDLEEQTDIISGGIEECVDGNCDCAGLDCGGDY